MSRPALQLVDQPELELGIERSADPSLAEAYGRTRLAEFGITLDKALRTPHLRLPLERLAGAIAAARVA